MSRGFGSTFGAGTTDLLTTRLTTIPSKSSWSCWIYMNGNGGGTFGKAFIGSATTGIFLGANNSVPSAGSLQFGATFSTTSLSLNFSAGLRFGVWEHIGIVYDGSGAGSSFRPTCYVNGVSAALTVGADSVGTFTSGNALYIGNRSDGLRNWDGMIAHLAMWNVLLSQAEVVALAAGTNPLLVRPESSQLYMPLDGINNPELDFVNGNSSAITGGRLGTSDPPVQSLSRIRSLYDYQNDKITAAGQILPFPWMQTSGGMRDMTGGMRN